MSGVRVRLRLLGPFGLEVDGADRAGSVPRRARSLLAYLVLRSGVRQARARVAGLLWPESTDGQALTNLRNVVHHLRRAEPSMEALVEVTPSTLRWRGGQECSVDVAEFLASVQAAGRAPAGSPEHVDALRDAVARYEGDLLEESRDEWLEEDRAGVREAFLDALRRLTEHLMRQTGPQAREAVVAARELVRRDPLAEEHHRLLISAHSAAGDRAGAVRAYHECVAVLRQELGVEPSALTRQAYARLVEVHAGDQPSPPQRPALVGRDAQLAELSRHWRHSGAGRPGLVLVTGEPGVGKTRLVEEFASRCARGGAMVATARSYPSEGELGYGVVIEWLRSPQVARLVRRASAADGRHLARLLPELGRVDDTSGAAGEAERALLFDAVARVLAATDRPVLLVADDAQWCDGPSLQLVHYLVRSATGRPLLVLATARAEDIDENHTLAAVTADLQALDRAAAVHVERLDEAGSATLARSLGARHLTDAAVRRLHEETEGNPLFVVEAVRAGWDGGGINLTPKLQAVIAARLRRLSPVSSELAQVAAAVGRDFHADLLRRAAGLDADTVARGLDELWRRGVIGGHAPDTYDFSHGKIREVVYATMSPALRAARHLALAQALAASDGERVDAASGQIAAHYEQAGRVEDAIAWYERASTPALRMGAHAEAYRMLQRALNLVDTLPEGVRLPLEARVLARLPAALGGVDGYASERLEALHERAATVATRLGAELEPPLLRSVVMASLCRDQFDQAAAAAGRLLAHAERAGDHGLVMESVYLQGIAAFWSGDLPAAATRFRDVVARFDPSRRAEHLPRFGQDPQVVCLSRLANTLWLQGDADQARTVCDEALALAARVGDPLTTDVARIFAALLAVDLDDAETFCRIARTFADDRPRGGAFAIKGEALLGYADVLEGRATAGIERIEQTVRRCGAHNYAPGFVPTLHRMLVAAYVAGGDPAAGLVAADRALGLGGTRLWEPEVRRLRADFLSRLGRPGTQVAAELDRATAAATRLGAAGAAAKIAATRSSLSPRVATPPGPTPRKRSRNGGLDTLPA